MPYKHKQGYTLTINTVNSKKLAEDIARDFRERHPSWKIEVKNNGNTFSILSYIPIRNRKTFGGMFQD